MAKKLRGSMSHDQLHDFAVGSMENKPEHIADPLLKGSSPSIMGSNASSLKAKGASEFDATMGAIKASKKGHPNRHKNLGKFLHSKKA